MIIDAPKREQLPALRSLWKEAFGDTDEFLDAFEQTAFRTDHCRCVTLNGETVAALYWFDCSFRERNIAYLYAIATAKTHRGQGICRALMEDTHRHLRENGYRGAILVPDSKQLFDLYEKIGYRICSHVQGFCCSASEYAAKIQQIDVIEYSKLRRTFLPDGGVIQEKENTEFLKTVAGLYAGDGFLLAARREGDTLFAMELLGDPTAAPAIVAAFGCSEGRFRTPGEDIPFAMYHLLGNGADALPSYFGLAFD